MRNRSYETTIRTTVKEIAELLEQRDVINSRLVQALSALRALSALSGESGGAEQYVRDLSERILQPPKLRDAIRLVLRLAAEPMAPVEIKSALESRGYDLRKYTFPMGNIHNALKALVRRKEVRSVYVREGAKFYSLAER